MEIPLNAQVECTDGVCGHSAYVLINPVTDEVTHMVVKEDTAPNTEYIVCTDLVTETVKDKIRLNCTKAELEKMEPFISTSYIEEKVPAMVAGYQGKGNYPMGSSFFMPYVTPETTVRTAVEVRQVPVGEIAVQRGTRVEATDGFVGKVDEFVIDPKTSHVTHLIMREGHLWGKRDVIIPVSVMGKTQNDTLFLSLDKKQVEALTTFPVQRRWS